MADDGVLEVHGCYVHKADGNALMLSISEFADMVLIESTYAQVKLTPAKARYIAAQFVRLANRIDARLNPQTAASNSEAKARGGRAAVASLTQEQRTERARKGADGRWKKAKAQ